MSTTAPHPVDHIRHNGLGWRDMPGTDHDEKKLNFFLYRYDCYQLDNDYSRRNHKRHQRAKTPERIDDEKRRFLIALAETAGNVLQASRLTGIPRHTHQYYTLHDSDYRNQTEQITAAGKQARQSR